MLKVINLQLLLTAAVKTTTIRDTCPVVILLKCFLKHFVILDEITCGGVTYAGLGDFKKIHRRGFPDKM